ncbi:hypothetical protein HYH02_009537 [Chlamydomonas schloesseri]|uniref:PPIase cyclophilin-type domain-containing protein n=1 Tax=Chlamydomonas schloesseri TaxID=2026947 RepID=A0A835W9Y6_9CHLO|nr:hypothetical protein HYH02_009537 [Chlamydomonas schloesseri]|eukprot:KAG2443126.1 hypothetical protein HYH02_009537 [Chlamydomonas schloesseri]
MARKVFALLFLGAALGSAWAEEVIPVMSDERVVFQTDYGDITFGFWPEVAPVTTAHIFKLVRLGCYTSNHFFRVDKGFVAQTSDVVGGRSLPMNAEQEAEAGKTVPLEVVQGVKHHAGVLSMARGADKNGARSSFSVLLGSAPHLDMQYAIFGWVARVLSMGRYDDPNSGASSFSVLLGDAPHLDMVYTAFAKVTEGMETLRKMEELPTKREGIFVMPLKRITIQATYWYRINRPEPALTLPDAKVCEDDLHELTLRFASQAEELQRVRKKCLPA